MQRQLRIATRSSALAMAQTNYVMGELKQECEIIKVSNEVGDVNLQDPLYKMPTVGVFTKQVEQYLLEQKADVAVHFLKDLPTIIDNSLYLATYTKFEQRGDVVLLNKKYNYKSLSVGLSNYQKQIDLINIRGKTKVEEFAQTKALEQKVLKDFMQQMTKQVSKTNSIPTNLPGFTNLRQKNNDIEKLQAKIKETNLPEHVLEIVEQEMQKLEKGSMGVDSNVTRNYIDLILQLPWNQQVEETLSIDKCKETLDADHFGLTKVKERILQFLAVKNLRKVSDSNGQGNIVCFFGPPEVGKTSFGQSIAKSLNRPFYRIALGGVSDEAQIRPQTYLRWCFSRILYLSYQKRQMQKSSYTIG